MRYAELVEYMHQYRTGKINKREMTMALILWQEPVRSAERSDWFRKEAAVLRIPVSTLFPVPGVLDPNTTEEAIKEAMK